MIRVFNKENLVVVVDTETWKVTKRAEGTVWYRYVSIESPILYNVYQKDYETPLVLDKDYTKFAKEDGETFVDDLSLQIYLDEVFSPNLTLQERDGSETFASISGSETLRVTDIPTTELLKGIHDELKIIRFHLSTITEDDITEKDVK